MNAPSTIRRCLIAVSLALTLAGNAPAVLAQAWPTQPVKIVVPQGPGSGSDILARYLGIQLGQTIGQPVIVENRVGGGGVIGHESVLRADDDHTFVFSSTAQLFVVPYLNDAAKYRFSDFTPVAPVMRAPFVVLVPNTEQAPKTLAELIASLKAKPQAYSSSGFGTMTHLGSEMLLKRAGVQATHVPYKGSGASLNDLIGQQVAFSTDSLTASIPLIQAGKLRPLAVTGLTRESALPDVPTLEESGYDGLTVAVLGGLLAPKNTSDAAADAIGAAMATVMASQEVKDRFAALQTQPLQGSRQDFTTLLSNEAARWEAVAKQLNAEAK